MGLRTGLDVMEKNLLSLPGIEHRLLGRPARSLVAILAPSVARLRI
jgi:hypothetical protein